jgi:hypothetical protein
MRRVSVVATVALVAGLFGSLPSSASGHDDPTAAPRTHRVVVQPSTPPVTPRVVHRSVATAYVVGTHR